jgi:hypothetical protein
MSNTTNVVSSNPAHCEVYLIQHFAIKFVGELRQTGFFPVSVILTSPLIVLGYELWCFTPLLATFQLYRGSQIYWWKKPEKNRSVVTRRQTL